MELASTRTVFGLAENFQIKGKVSEVFTLPQGHIHDTYQVWTEENEQVHGYILQRVNERIFPNPEGIADNISLITEHLKERFSQQYGSDKSWEDKTLTIIPTIKGSKIFRDEEGAPWRAFKLIDDIVSTTFVKNPEQAFQAAKAFGEFQKHLADFNPESLYVPLPSFHDAKRRFWSLTEAVAQDPLGRAHAAARDIRFALSQKYLTYPIEELIRDHLLPVRVTHNDTKISNVLLDRKTGEGKCVIDLDTVMPGTLLYDFGDMVRTFTNASYEDDQNLNAVYMRMDIFEALCEGYFTEAGKILIPLEKTMLVYSAKLLTYIMGMRFLTDYLIGDLYYKTERPTHNLDRCRNQFQLLRSMIDQRDAMKAVINNTSLIYA